MQDFFITYRAEIIFIHVISAVVWVGGMIGMRLAAHFGFLEVNPPKERLKVTAIALKRLFYMVLPFVILLAATGAIITIGYGIKHTDFHYLTHIKEAIWTIMFINLIAMIIRRNKAQKALENDDIELAKTQLGLIGKAMVPINIILGITEIILGVALRVNL